MRRHMAVLMLTFLINPTVQAELDMRQIRLLTINCLQCHAQNNIGAPISGNPAEWSERTKQGMEVLLANVIHGVRGMPPLGYCSACTEQDFREMIRFMTGLERITK